MAIQLNSISTEDLTLKEKESILSHAIDLHLVGSDDADSAGFDIVENRSANVLRLLRVADSNLSIGVVYLLPVARSADMVEMTVLIFPEFRGKHYTAPMVDAVEQLMRQQHGKSNTLCAAVHDHNPMRKELTEFLLRHGYAYSMDYRLFVKQLG